MIPPDILRTLRDLCAQAPWTNCDSSHGRIGRSIWVGDSAITAIEIEDWYFLNSNDVSPQSSRFQEIDSLEIEANWDQLKAGDSHGIARNAKVFELWKYHAPSPSQTTKNSWLAVSAIPLRPIATLLARHGSPSKRLQFDWQKQLSLCPKRTSPLLFLVTPNGLLYPLGEHVFSSQNGPEFPRRKADVISEHFSHFFPWPWEIVLSPSNPTSGSSHFHEAGHEGWHPEIAPLENNQLAAVGAKSHPAKQVQSSRKAIQRDWLTHLFKSQKRRRLGSQKSNRNYQWKTFAWGTRTRQSVSILFGIALIFTIVMMASRVLYGPSSADRLNDIASGENETPSIQNHLPAKESVAMDLKIPIRTESVSIDLDTPSAFVTSSNLDSTNNLETTVTPAISAADHSITVTGDLEPQSKAQSSPHDVISDEPPALVPPPESAVKPALKPSVVPTEALADQSVNHTLPDRMQTYRLKKPVSRFSFPVGENVQVAQAECIVQVGTVGPQSEGKTSAGDKEIKQAELYWLSPSIEQSLIGKSSQVWTLTRSDSDAELVIGVESNPSRKWGIVVRVAARLKLDSGLVLVGKEEASAKVQYFEDLIRNIDQGLGQLQAIREGRLPRGRINTTEQRRVLMAQSKEAETALESWKAISALCDEFYEKYEIRVQFKGE